MRTEMTHKSWLQIQNINTIDVRKREWEIDIWNNIIQGMKNEK